MNSPKTFQAVHFNWARCSDLTEQKALETVSYSLERIVYQIREGASDMVIDR